MAPKDAEYILKTIARSAEHAGKALVLLVAASFATGVLVENLALGRHGMSDFSLLHSRFVLVGAAFYVYVLAPLMPFLLAAFGVGLGRDLARRVRILPTSVASTTCGLVGLIYGIELPFGALNTFLTDGWPGPASGGPARILLDFWNLWLSDRLLGLHLLLFYIPTVVWIIIILFRPTDFTSAICRLWPVQILIFVGILSFVWPYSYYTFNHIQNFAGGGSPRVVRVSLDMPPSEYRAAMLDPTSLASSHAAATTQQSTSSGPLLLWNATDQSVYLSDPYNHPGTPLLVTEIPRSKILSISYISAVPIFSGESVVRIVGTDGFVKWSDSVRTATTVPAKAAVP
jgi:hypothetical protein